MRIIGGKLKGRKLIAPKNIKARPTTDFAKESLFNILNNEFYFDDLKVLDLFAGIGGVSFEFASRNCRVTLIEREERHIKFIAKTAREFQLEEMIIKRGNVFTIVPELHSTYDIVFADPPYEAKKMMDVPNLVFENKLLTEQGLLIVEHSKESDFSEHPNFDKTKRYGNVNFSFFRP